MTCLTAEERERLFRPKIMFLFIQIWTIILTVILLAIPGISLYRMEHQDVTRILPYSGMVVLAFLAVIKPAFMTLIKCSRYRILADNEGIRTYSGYSALENIQWKDVVNIEVPTGRVGSKLILRAEGHLNDMIIPSGIKDIENLFTLIVSNAAPNISRHCNRALFINRFPLFTIIQIVLTVLFFPFITWWAYINFPVRNGINPMILIGIVGFFLFINILIFFLSATLKAEITDNAVMLNKLMRTQAVHLSEIHSASITLTHKGHLFRLQLYLKLKNGRKKKIHLHGPDHFRLFAALNEKLQLT